MRSYTAHLKPGRPPILVREGWSWGAALFGPLWLLAHRAIIPAILYAALLALFTLAPGPWQTPALLGLMALAGLLGHDLVRWSLARRSYVLAHVLAARNADAALARLLSARTDIAARYAEHLA